jgi:hypothetical protein
VPTVLRVRGYRFFFFSLEDHEPPHVHAANAERYAKFWLDPVSVADVRGFRASEMTELRKIVTNNAPLLLERWYEYLGREN